MAVVEPATVEARPAAALSTETFRKSRPEIAGPEIPGPPFPILLSGAVQRGYGRGGKDLGCPTANLPDESILAMSSVTETGVYYGYAQVARERDGKLLLAEEDGKVFPMVMSLGWNPAYKNERMSAEIHIMHDFKSDFYGHEMRVVVLGYIRPELDYTSRGAPASQLPESTLDAPESEPDLDALVEDIETDKRVALQSVKRPAYLRYQADETFLEVTNPPRL